MWSSTHTVVSDVPSEVLWSRLIDVARWPEWNRGLTSAELDGEFSTGSMIRTVTMDGQTVCSRIVGMDLGRSFDDRTDIGDVQVHVRHEISEVGSHSVVTFSVEVRGDAADEIGRASSVDLPEILANLAVSAAAA